MSRLLVAHHLSSILEVSEKEPVILFIYSSECGSSERLAKDLEHALEKKIITAPVYKVTVQTQPALSKKIEEWFRIKHESPQIIMISKNHVLYTSHHNSINIHDLHIQ